MRVFCKTLLRWKINDFCFFLFLSFLPLRTLPVTLGKNRTRRTRRQQQRRRGGNGQVADDQRSRDTTTGGDGGGGGGRTEHFRGGHTPGGVNGERTGRARDDGATADESRAQKPAENACSACSARHRVRLAFSTRISSFFLFFFFFCLFYIHFFSSYRNASASGLNRFFFSGPRLPVYLRFFSITSHYHRDVSPRRIVHNTIYYNII